MKIDQWLPIATAPSGRDLEIAVIDEEGAHALIFPCRRSEDGWVNAVTKERMRLELSPTHWREWKQQPAL
jgi:hypothetical protein